MKKIVVLLAMLTLLCAGCQKPELEVFYGDAKAFTASVETLDDETKTSMNDEHKVVWSSGDLIAIFNGSTLAEQYQLEEGCSGATKGKFTLVPNNSDDSFSAGTDIPCNVAFYPYSDELTLTGASVGSTGEMYEVKGYSLPLIQKYVPGTFGNGAFPMAAVTTSPDVTNLQFKNVLGAMKLSLKGSGKVKTIKIRGKNGEKLAGAAVLTVYADNRAPVLTMDANASTEVTLDCGSGVVLNEDKVTDFFIALPPLNFQNGFTVLINDSNEGITLSANVSNTVIRSSILEMPAVTLESSDNSGEDYVSPITIDGDFSDWDALDPFKVFTTDCAPDAGTALKKVKVYADDIYLNVYFELDENKVSIPSDMPFLLGFDIYINQDASKGLYDQYFKGQTGTDFLFEALFEDGNLYEVLGLFRYGGSEDEIWRWDWTPVPDSESVPCYVRGSGCRYEVSIMTYELSELDLADTFELGFLVTDVTNGWQTIGVLPNLTNDGINGIAPMLPVSLNANPNIFKVSSVNINKASVALYEGSMAQVTATVLSIYAKYDSVVWTSSDPAIATVDQNGWITAVSEGFATINATAGGKTGSCVVTVNKTPSVVNTYVDEYGVDYGPGVEVDGVVWAPVNCGYDPIEYKYGRLYQWGRKYGQGYYGALISNGSFTKWYSDATSPIEVIGGVLESVGNHYSNANIFYIATQEWQEWMDVLNQKLWNGGTEDAPVKTEADPCPYGWRVPTYTELSALSKNYSEWTFDITGLTGFKFSGSKPYSAGVPQLFLPAAGDNSDIGSNGRGSAGSYWTSSCNVFMEGSECYLWFYQDPDNYVDEDVWFYSSSSSYGASVRCVQE